MDQQMRKFRVTSCWFGKTVKEVERRRFVKLKRCVLEPAARGLWYLKFSDSKTMSFEEVDTTAFLLHAERFSRWIQQRFSSDANSAATQLQQLAFSNADFVFSTEILDAKQGKQVISSHATSKFSVRKTAVFTPKICGNFSRIRATRLHTKFLTRAKHLRDLGRPDFRLRQVHIKPDFEYWFIPFKLRLHWFLLSLYGSTEYSGFLGYCVTNDLDPLEEQNLGTDQ
ncbi:hypothetical protein F511_09256 [Dorcoceras hygrometricum]|uniref:Uncharacterized protein n=1 Tax=Dorcoceras hygrometricum TaxID=472368 RepID=A0A2Z7CXG0_9LAMI|nr:hypothetical protein F511_09256 [Dorcoceras hygrometricum]